MIYPYSWHISLIDPNLFCVCILYTRARENGPPARRHATRYEATVKDLTSVREIPRKSGSLENRSWCAIKAISVLARLMREVKTSRSSSAAHCDTRAGAQECNPRCFLFFCFLFFFSFSFFICHIYNILQHKMEITD